MRESAFRTTAVILSASSQMLDLRFIYLLLRKQYKLYYNYFVLSDVGLMLGVV